MEGGKCASRYTVHRAFPTTKNSPQPKDFHGGEKNILYLNINLNFSFTYECKVIFGVS